MTWSRLAGLAIGVLATAVSVALSHVPIAPPGLDGGLLRLTWRARPQRLEHCREQSAAVLESLPAHMRQPTICDGVNATYRLAVRLDGNVVRSAVLVSGGLRQDRPIYVFEEISVTPGARHVEVRLDRIETDDPAPGDVGRLTRGELIEALPPTLVFAQTLTFVSAQVRLISYDPARREFVEIVR
jgi:hypothetical protein